MHEEEAAPQRPDQPPQQPGPEGAIAPEISRRVGSILDAVETEAARLREETRAEAARYLEDARRYADGLVAERQRRIAELSDELVSKSEAVVARLDDAVPVRQGFENLVRALGDAAERLAQETDGPSRAFDPPPYGGERQPAYAQPQGQPPQEYRPQPQSAPPTAYAPPQPPPQPALPPTPQQPAYERQPFAPPAPGYPLNGGNRQPPAPAWETAPQAPPAPQAPQPPPAAPAPPATTRRTPAAEAGWRELDEARMVAIQMAAGGSTRGAVREHLHRSLGVPEATGILDEVFGAGTGEGDRVPWTAGPR